MTMPTFVIEQYEMCVTKYRVEASSEAEASPEREHVGAAQCVPEHRDEKRDDEDRHEKSEQQHDGRPAIRHRETP